jgi:cell division protein FtsI/penicillin-binding protein 2
MGKRQKCAMALTTLMLAAALSSCSPAKSGAQDAANALAGGLSALDVGSLSFTGGKDGKAATDALRALAKPLEPVKPSVKVKSVDAKDDAATATFSVEWKLGSGSWSYDTTAALSRKDDIWSAQWTPALLVKGLTDGQTIRVATSYAKRADILGAGGAVLVTDRPVIHVGLDKTHVGPEQQPASAKALAELSGVDPVDYAKQVAAAGASAFVETLTIRDDASRTITDEQLAAIPGASGIKDTLALGPTRTFARAILGTVGAATAELIDASKGALHAGDTAGLSGLEQQYDAQLRGTAGISIRAVPAQNPTPEQLSAAPVLYSADPKAGTPLTTTISPDLENLAESILAGETDTPAAIVAIRPSTGDILAAASSPGSNGYNTAMLGQYAPGSTFKVATSLALLRKGQTPDTTEHCTPEVTVNGKVFHNAGTYPSAHLGEIPLREAFAHSCNTAFISARDVASQQDLASAAASLGIGVDSNPGMAAFFGSVPASAEGTSHAASMIGQGQVLVSPLAIANVAASVEQGVRVSPRIIVPPASSAVPSSSAAASAPASGGPASASGSATASSPAPASASPDGKPLTAAETATLKEMMRGVITSGHAGFLASVPGAPVIAKTGTAEYGTDNPLKTHAWIIAAQGDLAVAVFVEDGSYGAVSGGPMLTAFLTGAQGK